MAEKSKLVCLCVSSAFEVVAAEGPRPDRHGHGHGQTDTEIKMSELLLLVL